MSPFNAVPVNTPQAGVCYRPHSGRVPEWQGRGTGNTMFAGSIPAAASFNLCVVILFMGCQYHACCSGNSATNPGQALDKSPLPTSGGLLPFQAMSICWNRAGARGRIEGRPGDWGEPSAYELGQEPAVLRRQP